MLKIAGVQFSGHTKRELNLEKITRYVTEAARNGARILTREILIEKPDAKPKFEKAMAELAELQKLETVKTTDLLAIVNRIPKESRTVRLTVDGVTTVIYIAGDPTILPSETTAQLKLVAAALEAGIRDGMAEVP